MSYQLVYGTETETLEDPTQLLLVDMPDDWADYDSDAISDLISIDLTAMDHSNIGEHIQVQVLVGLTDVVESFRLAMFTEGVDMAIIDTVVTTVVDAVANNHL